MTYSEPSKPQEPKKDNLKMPKTNLIFVRFARCSPLASLPLECIIHGLYEATRNDTKLELEYLEMIKRTRESKLRK